MAPATVILMRLLHIVLGAIWVGFAVFVAMFLMPSLRAIGPAGGPVIAQLVAVRRFPLYMMSLAILTVLSGIGLYWHDSEGFSSAWMHTPGARAFGAGAGLAIIAVILGMSVNSPTGKRMSALAVAMRSAGGPPSPEQMAELERQHRRMAGASTVAAVLLVLAAAAMAVARYV